MLMFVRTQGLNVLERADMSYQSETRSPAKSDTRSAQDQIETEILRAANPQLGRRKQALQLVDCKLDKLSPQITASRRILNDLRTLRRLLLEERKTLDSSSIP